MKVNVLIITRSGQMYNKRIALSRKNAQQIKLTTDDPC